MKKNGFTLIELMIVVAIIAILGVVAINSYHVYVSKRGCQGDYQCEQQLVTGHASYQDQQSSQAVLHCDSGYVILSDGVHCK